MGIAAQPIITNKYNPPKNINYTIDHHTTDDDDNESILRTRL